MAIRRVKLINRLGLHGGHSGRTTAQGDAATRRAGRVATSIIIAGPKG